MKKKTLETALLSFIGVAAMLLILVAINFIAALAHRRVDLTAEHAYTLSAGTKAILARIDTPVQIRFYCSQKESTMPVQLKTYAQQVDDLLREYQQSSRGFIEVQKLDPEPDSDAEDSAKLDGVEGQLLSNGERIYLGISVSQLDQKQAIPFLAPSRERLLEYDISRAIARVITPDKPAIGVLSSLPVMGAPMMPMRQEGPSRWAFISELEHDYTVKQIEANTDAIPDDIKVLVVIHPKGVSETTQYALDQFVLRGGKLIAFLDAQAVLDPENSAMSQFNVPSSKSNLDKLLKAWGITFDTSKVLADMDFVARTRQGRAPAVLALTEKAVNKDDIATASANNLVMVFSGVFSGSPAPGLKETVLVHSSSDSQLVDPLMAQVSGEEIAKNFKSSGTEYPLAIRLAGKFKTAFPEGKPKKAAEASPNEKKEEPGAKTTNLKESQKETTVVLVGDSDMMQDAIAVRKIWNLSGQPLFMPANGNLAFAENIVDQLAGDSSLIAVRSRASRERPFTVVKKMQEDAEATYRGKIKELEGSLAETQRKINQLQTSKQDGQRFIFSSEQQEELGNFRKTEVEVKNQLKDVRKKLRADIDSLENKIKWINVAAMPSLVALLGLGFAVVKRKRAAAP